MFKDKLKELRKNKIIKKLLSWLRCICFIMLFICLSACGGGDEYNYIPKGEFYIKTPPAKGDAGVKDVIDIEAEFRSYQGEGNITVPVTIGFGHKPNSGGYGEDANDTFYILYQVFEIPLRDNPQPAWEKKAEYSDSFYDAKYNSTESKDNSFLCIPSYGEFYPLYKETVEITFPEGVQRGIVRVNVYAVLENYNGHSIIEQQISGGLEFSFTRLDDAIKLDSEVQYF